MNEGRMMSQGKLRLMGESRLIPATVTTGSYQVVILRRERYHLTSIDMTFTYETENNIALIENSKYYLTHGTSLLP